MIHILECRAGASTARLQVAVVSDIILIKLQYHSQWPSLCRSSFLRSLFYKRFPELIRFYKTLFNCYESKTFLW
jgi:hypothetical protein